MKVDQQIRELGQRVKDRRYLLNMTHVDVARKSKRYGWPVSQPTISKIEDKKITTLPGGNILIGLALALDTSPDDLLAYTPPAGLSPLNQLPTDVRKIAEIALTLTPDLQADALRYAQNAKNLATFRSEQEEMNARLKNHLYLKDMLSNVTSLPPEQQRAILEALRQAGVAGEVEGAVRSGSTKGQSTAVMARSIASLVHNGELPG